MSNLAVDVDKFLTTVADPNSDNDSLEASFGECLSGELALRALFALDRNNPVLRDPYIGLLNVFDLPVEVRQARPRLWGDSEDFIWRNRNENVDHVFPSNYILPVKDHLRRAPGTSCTNNDISKFRAAWDVFSGGALLAIKNWANIVVAGGSVLASLSSFPSDPSIKDLHCIYQSSTYKRSDIDLFIWGLNEEEGNKKMVEISETIEHSLPWNTVCFRQKNTITIQAEFPKRPIQIILRLYHSPSEVLSGFDVDCCCFAYDGTSIFTNPRGLAALVSQSNRIDLTRRSPSYEHRLGKYARRGFEIYYPALDRGKIDYVSLSNPERIVFPQGLGRLIVYEIIDCNYKYFPRLFENSARTVPSKPIAVESLRISNYDYGWCKIPYGPGWWDPEKVKENVMTVERLIIDALSDRLQSNVPVHYHAITSGTMKQCLEKCCDKTDVAAESPIEGIPLTLFRGPARFMKDNPGRQLIGSFNPSNYKDWEAEAYLRADED